MGEADVKTLSRNGGSWGKWACPLFALVSLIALVLFGSYMLYRKPRHRFSEELCRQIEPGMTQAEVEGVLGCSSGDYTTGPYMPCATGVRYVGCKHWISDEGQIAVSFDENGRVVFADYLPIFGLTESTFLEKLRRFFQK
jgi:hypothetical protein